VNFLNRFGTFKTLIFISYILNQVLMTLSTVHLLLRPIRLPATSVNRPIQGFISAPRPRLSYLPPRLPATSVNYPIQGFISAPRPRLSYLPPRLPRFKHLGQMTSLESSSRGLQRLKKISGRPISTSGAYSTYTFSNLLLFPL